MSEGLMTEREWRRQYVRIARKRTDCWGAQCWKPKPRWRQNRRNWACLLLGAWAVALLLPVIAAPSVPREYSQLQQTEEALLATRPQSSAVSYVLPEGIACSRQIFPKEQLLRGKLLYLDENHVLPDGTPAPNTMSIARYGNGMVPVNDLTIKSGKETIRALARLFAALRGSGADGFKVSRGTMTPLEQRE